MDKLVPISQSEDEVAADEHVVISGKTCAIETREKTEAEKV